MSGQNRPVSLNARQRRAVAMVAAGASNEAIRSELRIAESTLRRWQRLSSFDQAVKAIQTEAETQLSRMLAGNAIECVENILRIARDRNVSPKTQLDASVEYLRLSRNERDIQRQLAAGLAAFNEAIFKAVCDELPTGEKRAAFLQRLDLARRAVLEVKAT